MHKNERYNNKPKYFKYDLINEKTAYMKVGTFGYDRSFRRFMDTAFARIKRQKVENVIVDMRDNEGGNDYNGVYFYSYLTDQPFKYYSNFKTGVSIDPKSISKVDCCLYPEDLEYLLEVSTKDASGNYYISDYESTGKVDPKTYHQPKPWNFKGKVYILINGGSFSCTSEFSAIAHFHNRATFIGEETGGGYFGNTSYFFSTIELPNTKLRADLALVEYASAVEDSKAPYGYGIIPDYKVYPTAIDVMNGTDTELEYTLELIKKGK